MVTVISELICTGHYVVTKVVSRRQDAEFYFREKFPDCNISNGAVYSSDDEVCLGSFKEMTIEGLFRVGDPVRVLAGHYKGRG